MARTVGRPIEPDEYTVNNGWNAILKAALTIVSSLPTDHDLGRTVRSLLVRFDAVGSPRIDRKHFDRLVFDRSTEVYRYAVSLARLIILNYSPDLTGGRESVLGMLFDMDKLFERFIYVELARAARQRQDVSFTVTGQRSERFWNTRTIRPDIILSSSGAHRDRIVVDTKWKVLHDYAPSAQDLRQMYAYNLHFGARRGFIVYPYSGLMPYKPTDFVAPRGFPEVVSACGLYFVRLFDEEGSLRKDIGMAMLTELTS